MRMIVVAAMLLGSGGCFLDPWVRPEHAEKVRQEKQERQEAEGRRAVAAVAARARERQAEAERERQDRETDRACLEADTPQLIRLCDAREREKDRAAQREQWAQENEMRERDVELRRQELEFEQRRQRRLDLLRALAAPPASAPRPINCSSIRTGDYTSTSCY